jgi:hypothetical protein
MFKRFSLHLALIFVFAFAQIGAVTHGISHFNDYAKQNKTSQSQQDTSKQEQSTHSEQCGQCISFAKIAGGLVAQSYVFPTSQASFIGITQLQTQASTQTLSAYAARAPPATTFI